MKITLNNGATLDALAVNGSKRHFQGELRDSLEIQFAKEEVNFGQLDTLFLEPENTKRIILQQGDEMYLHENYILRVSLSLSPVVVTPATDTEPEVTEERYSIVLAQKTYKEAQMESLRETVDLLVLESLLEV
jgi:hypothetical protein